MCPCIGRRTHRIITGTVRIFKIMFSVHQYHAMIIFSGRYHCECTFPTIHSPYTGRCNIPPFPGDSRHKPYPISILTIIKPFHRFLFLSTNESSGKTCIKRIPFGHLFKTQLKPVPTFHFVLCIYFYHKT